MRPRTPKRDRRDTPIPVGGLLRGWSGAEAGRRVSCCSGKQKGSVSMYLRTRLLFGIGTVTLVALLVSLLLPLESIRSDVARETDASMQLAQLLLDVQHAVANAKGSAEARFAA